MKQVTFGNSENTAGPKSDSDLKCESCEGCPLQAVPGEVEALSALGEVCAALKEVREIADRISPPLLIIDPEGGGGENRDDDDVTEARSQEANDEIGLQRSHSSLGTKNDPECEVATEKLVEVVASRILRKCGRKSMRITLSAKTDTPAKENEDRTGSARAGNSNRLSPPEEISVPVDDSATSHATVPQTESAKKKGWNFFKLSFWSRRRK